MSRTRIILLACAVVVPSAQAQESGPQSEVAASPEEAAIRRQLEAYLEAFNQHDAAEVAKYWSTDGESLAENSGETITGREALQTHFQTFFEGTPTARLTGEITGIKIVRPDVALIEGQTTLFVAEVEPVQSTFSALLVKDGDGWLISSSRERDLPPQSARDALGELEWLVGTWQDQSDDAVVNTQVRWSLRETFLIRSFSVQAPDAEPLEGTQVIGWDPLNRQMRTWTFNSDGSFGEGTLARHDDAWLLKMWQVRSDGQLAEGTQVITRVDADTLTMQFIGESVDGELLPSSDPVTVLRVVEASSAETDESPSNLESKP